MTANAAAEVECLWMGQQVGHLDRQIFIFDPELDGLPQAGCHADCMIALAEQLSGTGNGGHGPDVDGAKGECEFDIGADNLLVEAMIGDEVHHAPQLVTGLDQIHLVAQLSERRGCSQTGWPAADNGDLPAIGGRYSKLGDASQFLG